ncbi:MAG: class I SAM-dependent methyltransferase family protein [Methanosarcinales archaeon]|jgi:tRNA (guanine37-N1)-methyltransferase|nr:class I SAM-dependent methyltransferase family protein [Methanosarcinales archaeon]
MKEDSVSSDGSASVIRYAFRIHKEYGEPARRILDEAAFLDHSCKPFADDLYLYLPLLCYPEKEERLAIRNLLEPLLKQLPRPKEKAEFLSGYVKDISFKVQRKAPTVPDLLGFSVAYEIIGDIAVLDDKVADSHEKECGGCDEEISKIADAILTAHPSVKTVLFSKGPISGEFRTRDLEFVAGINKTETIHKEYGCKYKVDLGRAYFTPRLSTERHRIAEQIQAKDTVIDMFAGVGPYSILIAKQAKPVQIIANDKNDAAAELLKENIVLNKVKNITVLNEDAAALSEMYPKVGDHVIMNLPHNACDFLDTAVSICKKGGVIHYYAMTSDDDLFDGSIEMIRKAAEKQGREIKVLEKRNVRSYAPHQYNICLDVKLE